MRVQTKHANASKRGGRRPWHVPGNPALPSGQRNAESGCTELGISPVKGILPRGMLTVLSGKDDRGKTLLALEMARRSSGASASISVTEVHLVSVRTFSPDA